MSISRRSLFRGAAATGVAVATGGAGKVAQGAVIAAGGAAGIASSLTKARGIYEIFAAAGKTFPHREIFDASQSVLGRIKSVDQKTALQNRLLGRADYARYDQNRSGYENSDFLTSNHKGKIDYSLEKSLFNVLEKLPSDIPLMDLLSDDFYMVAILSGDVGSKHGHGGPSTSTAQQVKALKEMLEPLCDENTTAADLKNTVKNFFVRLGHHALSRPDDFATTSSNGFGNSKEISVFTEIHDVRDILERTYDANLSGLTNALKQKANSYKREITPLHEEKMAIKQAQKKDAALKRHQERTARQNSRENEQGKENKATEKKRSEPLTVKLRKASETEFIVDQTSKKIPSRKDWFNWMRFIDPEDAKICDIKTSHGGFAVTLQNQIAIDFLNAKTDEDHTVAVLEFPNEETKAPSFDQIPG